MSTRRELEHPRARELLFEALQEDPPRLDRMALSISVLEKPELELGRTEAALDALAARVTRALAATGSGPGVSAMAQLQALQRVLAHEEGFTGNRDDYAAPENSFLEVVMETKVGIPISLSVLYLEVGRRADIPLYGVGFPGHFLVAVEAGDRHLVLDPFHDGQILTEEGCAELLAKVAPQLKFSRRMLTPATPRAIASRMLANLKRTYLERSDGERALRVVDLMLAIAPDHPGELRARAAILSALGAFRAALADVERCLELSPAAPDHQTLMMTANALRQRVSFLN